MKNLLTVIAILISFYAYSQPGIEVPQFQSGNYEQIPSKPDYSIYKTGSRTLKSVFHYNPAGLVDTITGVLDNALYSQFKFTYDANNKVVDEVEYYATGHVTQSHHWAYSATNNTYTRTYNFNNLTSVKGNNTSYTYTGSTITSTTIQNLNGEVIQYFYNQTWRNFAKRQPQIQYLAQDGYTYKQIFSYGSIFGLNYIIETSQIELDAEWVDDYRESKYYTPAGALTYRRIENYNPNIMDWEVDGEYWKIYDSSNRLVKDSTVSGQVINYFYNGGNLRQGVDYSFLASVETPGSGIVTGTIKDDQELSLYPNPATNLLNLIGLNGGLKNIIICNMLGVQVYNLNTEEQNVQIHLSFNPGLYMVQVMQNGKIVKQSQLVID
jgi:hypothetical protein